MPENYRNSKCGQATALQVSLIRKADSKGMTNVDIDSGDQPVRLGVTHSTSDFYPKSVRASSPYGPYISKEDLKLPWISCLWCDYKDKIEFDLSLHFLEQHKVELLAIPITRQERLAAKALIKDPRARFFAKFESPMEYRLDKAVSIAKQRQSSRSDPNGEVSKNVP